MTSPSCKHFLKVIVITFSSLFKGNLIHLLFQSRGKANLSDNVPFPLARDKSDCLYDGCLPEVKNK